MYKTFIYSSSPTILSSSVTSISSLHSLYLFLFLFKVFLFSFSPLSSNFPPVSFNPYLNCQVASYLAMAYSEVFWAYHYLQNKWS